MRMLILEDNKKYAQLAKQLLPQATVVTDIVSGLRELETGRYGILVTDLFMQTPDRYYQLVQMHIANAHNAFARFGQATPRERSDALSFAEKPSGLLVLAKALSLDMLAIVVTSQDHHGGAGRAATAAARTIVYNHYKRESQTPDHDARWVAWNLVVFHNAHKGAPQEQRSSIWSHVPTVIGSLEANLKRMGFRT